MTKIVLLITTILAIGTNVLAIVLPLNNKTTQELSNKFDVSFTPASYVFSIWGLIYIGMIAFSIYQMRATARLKDNTRYWFILSNIANAAWIFAWHYEKLEASVAIIIVLLISLIMTYRRSIFSTDLWLYRYPISLYLGWISVATIANITVLLYQYNFSTPGITPEMWTSIMVFVASLLGCYLLYRYKDYTFNFVVIWAIVGIAYDSLAISVIVYPVLFCIAMISVVAILTLIRKFEFQTNLQIPEQTIQVR